MGPEDEVLAVHGECANEIHQLQLKNDELQLIIDCLDPEGGGIDEVVISLNRQLKMKPKTVCCKGCPDCVGIGVREQLKGDMLEIKELKRGQTEFKRDIEYLLRRVEFDHSVEFHQRVKMREQRNKKHAGR
jgi:hypothetical protein